MNYIAEGGQCKVFEIDNKFAYRDFKSSSEFPPDNNALKVMCEIGRLKRIVVSFKINYDDNGNIKSSVSKYIISEEIDIYSTRCFDFYKWYIEFKEDIIKLSAAGIRIVDFTAKNMIINNLGMFLIDVNSFKYIENFDFIKLFEQNLEDLNYAFIYEILFNDEELNISQTCTEIIEEIRGFSGTLYEYLQSKKFSDYIDKSITIS